MSKNNRTVNIITIVLDWILVALSIASLVLAIIQITKNEQLAWSIVDLVFSAVFIGFFTFFGIYDIRRIKALKIKSNSKTKEEKPNNNKTETKENSTKTTKTTK